MEIVKEVSERFADFIFDWDYEKYLLLGGYGSGKSYAIALKLILKLFEETRKALVVREVYDTITESCFDLFKEILSGMDLLADEDDRSTYKTKVRPIKSPMQLKFPNGSRIIFKGMDKPEKVKSLNGVSIVWFEECSEIKYDGYKEMLGRIRTPDVSMHFILSCNPVGKENWVYRHFFKKLNEDGSETTILDDEELYNKKTIVHNGVYYHHSTLDDNPYLPAAYIKRIDDIKNYDIYLWRIARWGRFGASGIRVLPQFEIAKDAKKFKEAVSSIQKDLHFYGFDFGFETSYNAVVSMAVDDKNKYLYIYDEIYKNRITDDKFALEPDMIRLKDKLNSMKELKVKHNPIVADNEDPKAIKYYKQQGFEIRACRNKFVGSRLSNTRKVKRFRKIICSPKCKNVIRELKELTYLKKPNGDTIYDQFNIDPHTFSAIWYALDTYTVADPKQVQRHSKDGS